MSAQDQTVTSFTLPDAESPDHPLSLVRTLERAQEFLEAGETADTRAAIQGALEKAREANIDESDAAAREQEMHKRVDRVLGPGFCNLADYLRTGQPHGLDPHRELIDHATALAEVLAHVDTKSDEITDSAVPRATHLLFSLLFIARTVGDCETEIEAAKSKARMNGAEGGSHE